MRYTYAFVEKNDLPFSPFEILPADIRRELKKLLLGPDIRIISDPAIIEESKEVKLHVPGIADPSYDIYITYDDTSRSISAVAIGYCKYEEVTQSDQSVQRVSLYKIKKLNNGSLHRYITEDPLTYKDERNIPFQMETAQTEEEFLLREYLEQAIKAEGGLTRDPMRFIARLAQTSKANYNAFSLYLKRHAHRRLLHDQAYHKLGIFRAVKDNTEMNWLQGLQEWMSQETNNIPKDSRSIRYEGALLKILVGNPEFLTQKYQGDIGDAASRRWHNPSMIKLALVFGQRFIYKIIEEFIKATLASANPSLKKRQAILTEKQNCLSQLEVWEYPEYLLRNKPALTEINALEKGIYVYRENNNVYALVVHGLATHETIDLQQCFLRHGLTQDSIKQELDEITWPSKWQESCVPTQLPPFIQTAIDHYRQHPNGLVYTLNNPKVKGVQILDEDWLGKNLQERERYEQEAEEYDGYHLIVKMKPENPNEVESCWLGLCNPENGLYQKITVTKDNAKGAMLFDLAKDLHDRLNNATDEFGNRLTFYSTREPEHLQAVKEFAAMKGIETDLKQQTSRVDLFSLSCCLLNQIGYWSINSTPYARLHENYLARVCLFLRLAPSHVVQLWLSEAFKWWEYDFNPNTFVQNRYPMFADMGSANHDGVSIIPFSSSLGSKIAAGRGGLAGLGGPRDDVLLNSSLQAETLPRQDLKSTLKMR